MHTSVAILSVIGSQATRVLDGLVTQKVTDGPFFSCMCNRKGQVISPCVIEKVTDGYYVAVDASLAERVLEHLRSFSRFDRLTIECLSERSVLTEPLQFRPSSDEMIAAEWERYQYNSGMCFFTEDHSEKYTPQMLAYDQLDGISWDKGCYLGQEIIVRIAHRGTNKRHLIRWHGKMSQTDIPGKHLLYLSEVGGLTIMDGREIEEMSQMSDVFYQKVHK